MCYFNRFDTVTRTHFKGNAGEALESGVVAHYMVPSNRFRDITPVPKQQPLPEKFEVAEYENTETTNVVQPTPQPTSPVQEPAVENPIMPSDPIVFEDTGRLPRRGKPTIVGGNRSQRRKAEKALRKATERYGGDEARAARACGLIKEADSLSEFEARSGSNQPGSRKYGKRARKS